MYYTVQGTNLRILGSIHAFPKSAELAPLPDRVITAVSHADEVVFECIWGDSSHMQLAPNESLHSLLPPALWMRVLGNYPAGLPDVTRLKPWAVGAMLAIGPLAKCDGVEPQVKAWAERAQRPISYLETSDELASGFDGLPEAEVHHSIEAALDNMADAQRIFEAGYQAWASGSVKAFWDVHAGSPILTMPSFFEAALASRNRRWVDRLVKEHIPSGKRTLVVVGALHLEGPENVLALLGAKGFDTVQIC